MTARPSRHGRACFGSAELATDGPGIQAAGASRRRRRAPSFAPIGGTERRLLCLGEREPTAPR
ncbi:MAG: hypothetical protein LC808_11180, partial [Actinobacteria bacterium]|nr:hypothetical protein [Actinomycetota bacterium]